MQFPYHALIGASIHLPLSPPTPVLSYSPIVLPAPDRPVDLQVRVSFPPVGENLPIILLSHGLGTSDWLSSLDGYSPLSDFWAGHGFVVMQPTHLDSKFLNLNTSTAPAGDELWWKDRAHDMVHILDQLDTIEDAVEGLRGRLDRSRIAVAGHSFGGWTASLLLGATNVDPRDNDTFRVLEPRIKTGVVLSGPGNGGDDLSDSGRQAVPFYGPDFETMTKPALVVYGSEDLSPEETVRELGGMRIRTDSLRDRRTCSGLLVGCIVWGVTGWDAKDAVDESVQRLESVRRLTWAYLRSQLYDGDTAWQDAKEAMGELPELGKVWSKASNGDWLIYRCQARVCRLLILVIVGHLKAEPDDATVLPAIEWLCDDGT